MEPTEMFSNLSASNILTQSTTWANNFDSLLLVVVGVGIGFACVRFVKSLFF
jgi:hypothetical protein